MSKIRLNCAKRLDIGGESYRGDKTVETRSYPQVNTIFRRMIMAEKAKNGKLVLVGAPKGDVDKTT